MTRLLAASLAATVAFTACSSDPLEEYFEQIGDITAAMRRDSIEALPNPAEPTLEGVSGVIAARRSAANALEIIIPPAEVRPEHTALMLALSDLVEAGDTFLAETAGLDPSAFTAALRSATGLDEIVRRVAIGCDALELRANQLGLEADLRC